MMINVEMVEVKYYTKTVSPREFVENHVREVHQYGDEFDILVKSPEPYNKGFLKRMFTIEAGELPEGFDRDDLTNLTEKGKEILIDYFESKEDA